MKHAVKKLLPALLALALLLAPAARADGPETVTAAPGTAVTLTAKFNNVHWESMQYEKVITSPGGDRQGRTATDYGALALVWRVDGSAVSGGTYEYDPTAGTVTAVYSYSGGSLGETHLVSCDCDVKYSGADYTNTLGTKSFSVTRRDLPKPVITKQPVSASAAVGGTLTFSVTASNAAAYSWSVCDAEYGQPYGWTTVKAHAAVSGETTAAMTLKPTDTWLNGLAVYCDIKGTDGKWYSSSVADITVTASAVPKPTITTQPVGKTGVKAGTPVTLSAAASGTGTLSYQWYQTTVNDISAIKAVTSALSSAYTVPQTPGTVYYCVGVTNTVGGKESEMVYSDLVAVTYSGAPVVTYNKTSFTVKKGEDATIVASVSIDAAAKGTITYQWYEGKNNIPGTAEAIGETNSDTFIAGADIPAGETRYYFCIATNTKNGVSSDSWSDDMQIVRVTAGSGAFPFKDVPAAEWCYESIERANRMSLINGVSDTTYEPYSNLRVAQAIKLAACMHQLYRDGAVTLENDSGVWYMSYVRYAVDAGIISPTATASEPGYEDYVKRANEPITRQEYVFLFSRALPDSALPAKNSIPDNSIPDVPLTESLYSQAVYKLYRAGILNGTDDYGTFQPDANIQRGAVAAILVRMMDASVRVGAPARLGQ